MKILLSPIYYTFLHLDEHEWYTEPWRCNFQIGFCSRWHYYYCYWWADAAWSADGIKDLLRDRRPYVASGEGDPTGWNPVTIYEFRSTPYEILEGDSTWWYTNFPGSIGISDSVEFEEQNDGYEEIEAWTRNPELFIPNNLYYVKFRYQVMQTGPVNVIFELELGNEDDNFAYLSPPGFPADYYDLDEKSTSHDTASWWEFIWLYGSSQKVDFLKTPNETEVAYKETHSHLDVYVVGKTPHFLEIWILINVHSKVDLQDFLEDRQKVLSNVLNDPRLKRSKVIPITITFNRILNPQEFSQFVSISGLEVTSFRFKAVHDGEHSRGQATPAYNETVPVNELKSFISPSDLLGIYRADGYISIDKIIETQQHPQVLLLDFSAFIALLNLNITANEMVNNVDDPFWLMEMFS